MPTRGYGVGIVCQYRASTAPPPPTEPGAHTPVLSPSGGHCSGRYASYWNAFLFKYWVNKRRCVPGLFLLELFDKCVCTKRSHSCCNINKKKKYFSVAVISKHSHSYFPQYSQIFSFFTTGELSGSEGEEVKEDNDAKDDDGGSSSASSVGENDATDGEISSSDAETGHKKKDKKKHKHKKKKKHKDRDKEKSKRKRTHSRFVFYLSCLRTRVNDVGFNVKCFRCKK